MYPEFGVASCTGYGSIITIPFRQLAAFVVRCNVRPYSFARLPFGSCALSTEHILFGWISFTTQKYSADNLQIFFPKRMSRIPRNILIISHSSRFLRPPIPLVVDCKAKTDAMEASAFFPKGRKRSRRMEGLWIRTFASLNHT
jgi:hypothetical protein